MIDESGHLVFAAWLATYLVHSTLLLGGAWLITKLIGAGRESIKETLWKCALIAPVLSATLQVGLQVDPIAGGVEMPERSFAAAQPWHVLTDEPHLESPAPVNETLPAESSVSIMPAPPLHPDTHGGPAPIDEEMGGAALSGLLDRTVAVVRQAWPALLLLSVIIAVTCLAAYAVVVWLRLRAMMRQRRLIADGPLAQTLQRLLARSESRRTVRLSISDRLTSPIAFGILRPEICLPARAEHDLSVEKQESMLAHELGHLLRHDPAWMALAHLIQRVLFFQPLNTLAFRRLRELAEFRCDAWAVELVGDRIALARCLTEVAGWIVQRRARTMLEAVPGMAAEPSALRRRVTRLLDDQDKPTREFDRRWLVAIVPAVIAVVTLSAPGVSARMKTIEEKGSATEPVPVELGAPGLPGSSDAMALLQLELSLLENELAQLREFTRRGPTDPALDSLIDELHRRARELRARHDDLFAQLSEMIEQNPDAARGLRNRAPGIDN